MIGALLSYSCIIRARLIRIFLESKEAIGVSVILTRSKQNFSNFLSIYANRSETARGIANLSYDTSFLILHCDFPTLSI